jgi:hypothetical protein
MQTSAYKAYRLAQARMADAHREAERWRLAKAVQKQRGSLGWLERLLRRRRAVAPKHRGGEAGEARPSARRAAPSTSR